MHYIHSPVLAELHFPQYLECYCAFTTQRLVYLQVIVTYASDKVDEFIELADAIENQFPELQVDGIEAGDTEHKFIITKEDGDIVTEAGSSAFPSASDVIDSLRKAGFR